MNKVQTLRRLTADAIGESQREMAARGKRNSVRCFFCGKLAAGSRSCDCACDIFCASENACPDCIAGHKVVARFLKNLLESLRAYRVDSRRERLLEELEATAVEYAKADPLKGHKRLAKKLARISSRFEDTIFRDDLRAAFFSCIHAPVLVTAEFAEILRTKDGEGQAFRYIRAQLSDMFPAQFTKENNS